jgi:hypothetical protein
MGGEWHPEAALMMAPICSPRQPQAELTTSPDVATDGVGGTGTMHASNRLIETSWRTAKIVVKAPEN